MKEKKSTKTYADNSNLKKVIKAYIDDPYFMEVIYYYIRRSLLKYEFNLKDVDGFDINGKYLGEKIEVEFTGIFNNVLKSLGFALSIRAMMLNSDYIKKCYGNSLLFNSVDSNFIAWDIHEIIMECIGDDDFSLVYQMMKDYRSNGRIDDDLKKQFKDKTVRPEFHHLEDYCKILADDPSYHGQSVIQNNAFLCSDIEEFTITKAIDYVGNTAFAYCEDLKCLIFEDKVIFGKFPIIECKNLKHIIVPKELIGYYKELLPFYSDIISDTMESKDEGVNDSDKENLWHCFDKKATSYKYFWLLSILQFYKENPQASIPYKNLVVKMISNAWGYVFGKEYEFPKTDQIPKYIDKIIAKYMLDGSSDSQKVESEILYYYERGHLDNLLSSLLKNVPYRFLSPWIPFTDNDDVITKSNNPDTRCLYSLHDDHITINPIWSDYLIENYYMLTQFVEKELRSYLKIR
jgi:hypothetical protein